MSSNTGPETQSSRVRQLIRHSRTSCHSPSSYYSLHSFIVFYSVTCVQLLRAEPQLCLSRHIKSLCFGPDTHPLAQIIGTRYMLDDGHHSSDQTPMTPRCLCTCRSIWPSVKFSRLQGRCVRPQTDRSDNNSSLHASNRPLCGLSKIHLSV